MQNQWQLWELGQYASNRVGKKNGWLSPEEWDVLVREVYAIAQGREVIRTQCCQEKKQDLQWMGLHDNSNKIPPNAEY